MATSTDRPSPPVNKPYRCLRCGYRSNWKSDVTKHVRALHPLSRVVAMDDDDATESLAEYEANRADVAEMKSAVEEKALYTVDRQVYSSSGRTSYKSPCSQNYYDSDSVDVPFQSPRHSYRIRCHLIFSHLHPYLFFINA